MKRTRQKKTGSGRRQALSLAVGLSLCLAQGPVQSADQIPAPNATDPDRAEKAGLLTATLESTAKRLTATTAAAGADQAAPPASPSSASTQSRSNSYDIRWHSLSAGGGQATNPSGDFQLRGSIGQHDASPDHPAAGPSYSHRGGFWVVLATRGKAVADRIFRDRFE